MQEWNREVQVVRTLTLEEYSKISTRVWRFAASITCELNQDHSNDAIPELFEPCT